MTEDEKKTGNEREYTVKRKKLPIVIQMMKENGKTEEERMKKIKKEHIKRQR